MLPQEQLWGCSVWVDWCTDVQMTSTDLLRHTLMLSSQMLLTWFGWHLCVCFCCLVCLVFVFFSGLWYHTKELLIPHNVILRCNYSYWLFLFRVNVLYLIHYLQPLFILNQLYLLVFAQMSFWGNKKIFQSLRMKTTGSTLNNIELLNVMF